MSEVIEKKKVIVENMIYEYRGKQIMLDTDLALLYNTETKRINEAVARNSFKFPDRFCFKISEKEYNILKSQIATSRGGSRKGHTAFTEEGVAMLSTVLKSKVAIKVSIAIMDAFVAMRHYISNNLLEQKYINNQVMKNTENIKLLQDSFSKFEGKKQASDIYFNGQIYDAYSKIYEIFNKTKDNLIIIDSYADNTILDIIKRLKVSVIIITKENNLLTSQDILKYNKQYNNLKVIFNNTFHDRYFILDNENIYHCGASINKIGYKTFSITLINDNFALETLFNRVYEIINS